MDLLTPLGITDPIVKPLEALLEFLHEQGNLTYGWAIVVLTVIVRLLISPLYIRQIRSMRRMQAYAPEIKALNEKYKGDRAKQQEVLMAFYKDNQINPFSSCLPMLLQAPIFIGLFYALQNFAREVTRAEKGLSEAVQGGKAAAQRVLDGFGDLSFMWAIDDISKNVTSIAAVGLIPLLLIYGLSQLLSFEVSSEYSTTPGKDRPAVQKWLFRLMPIPITLFVLIYPFPAGLLVYWVTTNLWTCGQAIVAKRILGPVEDLRAQEAPAGIGAKSSRTPPKSRPERPSRARAGAQTSDTEPSVAAVEGEPASEASAPEQPAPEPATPSGRAAKGSTRVSGPQRPAPKGGAGGKRRPPKKGGR